MSEGCEGPSGNRAEKGAGDVDGCGLVPFALIMIRSSSSKALEQTGSKTGVFKSRLQNLEQTRLSVSEPPFLHQ